ncbi:MAG: Hsp20/alpha crystallin family protein [Methylovulum sp.]|nr:Hsp20/alpha crystallin family protein [Methylovulum sp.]
MPSRDLESWMWAEACEMIDRADRLHRQFFRPAVLYARRPAWEPPVDVYETQEDYKIMVALPGVAPEHISVILDGPCLIIGGRRHLPVSPDIAIRRLEIPYGRFERSIELPAGRFEMGSREFVDGCLLITLRKRGA